MKFFSWCKEHEALFKLVKRVFSIVQKGKLLQASNLHSLYALLGLCHLMTNFLTDFGLAHMDAFAIYLQISSCFACDRAKQIHINLLFAILNVVPHS